MKDIKLLVKILLIQNVYALFVLAIYIYYSFDTGEYHESVGLVFTRVPQARA